MADHLKLLPEVLPMDFGMSAGALGSSLTMGAGGRPAAGRVMGTLGGRPEPGPAPVVTDTEWGASWGVVEWACWAGN